MDYSGHSRLHAGPVLTALLVFGFLLLFLAIPVGTVFYSAFVNADGSFMVEEYNWARPDTYSYRKATRGEGSSQFSSFIRFKR